MEGHDPRGARLTVGATTTPPGASPPPPPAAPADVAEGTAADLLAARVDAAWPAMGAEIVPGE